MVQLWVYDSTVSLPYLRGDTRTVAGVRGGKGEKKKKSVLASQTDGQRQAHAAMPPPTTSQVATNLLSTGSKAEGPSGCVESSYFVFAASIPASPGSWTDHSVTTPQHARRAVRSKSWRSTTTSKTVVYSTSILQSRAEAAHAPLAVFPGTLEPRTA